MLSRIIAAATNALTRLKGQAFFQSRKTETNPIKTLINLAVMPICEAQKAGPRKVT
jgi:hypothetical protein